MKRKALALVISSFLAGIIPAAPRERLAAPLQSAAPAPGSYPDTAEGLQQLLQDLLAAIRDGKKDRASALIESLIVPDHAAWFSKVFGPQEGATLDAKYTEALPKFADNLHSFLKDALKDGRTAFKIERWDRSVQERAVRLEKAVLDALQEPIAFYEASSQDPAGKKSWSFDYFFYVNGGFRRVDDGILTWLSNFTPRIRVGGQVQAAKVISQGPPKYPRKARDQRIQGTVRMQVLISTDGRVAELTLFRGSDSRCRCRGGRAKVAISAHVAEWQTLRSGHNHRHHLYASLIRPSDPSTCQCFLPKSVGGGGICCEKP